MIPHLIILRQIDKKRMNSALIMKLLVLFLLFVIAFDEAESEKQTDDNTICVERGDVSIHQRRLR